LIDPIFDKACRNILNSSALFQQQGGEKMRKKIWKIYIRITQHIASAVIWCDLCCLLIEKYVSAQLIEKYTRFIVDVIKCTPLKVLFSTWHASISLPHVGARFDLTHAHKFLYNTADFLFRQI